MAGQAVGVDCYYGFTTKRVSCTYRRQVISSFIQLCMLCRAFVAHGLGPPCNKRGSLSTKEEPFNQSRFFSQFLRHIHYRAAQNKMIKYSHWNTWSFCTTLLYLYSSVCFYHSHCKIPSSTLDVFYKQLIFWPASSCLNFSIFQPHNCKTVA